MAPTRICGGLPQTAKYRKSSTKGGEKFPLLTTKKVKSLESKDLRLIIGDKGVAIRGLADVGSTPVAIGAHPRYLSKQEAFSETL